MIILGKVRPLSRHLAEAHPQVLIIAQQWIAQRNLKPKTVAQYTALLDNHITPKLGKVLVR